MKKIIAILFIFLLSSCSSVDINKRLTGLDDLQEGTTLKTFVTTHGPPFSIEKTDNGIIVTHYQRATKSNVGLALIPVVNLVAAGNTYAIQRNILQFDDQDKFVAITDSQQVKGNANMWQMGTNEGMSGKGGRRSETDYRSTGVYLAEKGIFYDRERWKYQNIANNYFLKFR